MSYCRFSSNDFKCDVYVYENEADTYTIHVARNRLVGDIPAVPKDWQNIPAPELAKAIKSQLDAAQKAKRELIGLPFDGGTFCEPTPGATAKRLQELQRVGYLVPEEVIKTLLKEQAEAVEGSKQGA